MGGMSAIPLRTSPLGETPSRPQERHASAQPDARVPLPRKRGCIRLRLRRVAIDRTVSRPPGALLHWRGGLARREGSLRESGLATPHAERAIRDTPFSRRSTAEAARTRHLLVRVTRGSAEVRTYPVAATNVTLGTRTLCLTLSSKSRLLDRCREDACAPKSHRARWRKASTVCRRDMERSRCRPSARRTSTPHRTVPGSCRCGADARHTMCTACHRGLGVELARSRGRAAQPDPHPSLIVGAYPPERRRAVDDEVIEAPPVTSTLSRLDARGLELAVPRSPHPLDFWTHDAQLLDDGDDRSMITPRRSRTSPKLPRGRRRRSTVSRTTGSRRSEQSKGAPGRAP